MRSPGELRVFDTPAQVAAALADAFVEAARNAFLAHARFNVALAGGTTPKATYTLLAQPPYSDAIDWNAVHFFFGDERCVPPDHEQSNYRMADLALFEPLGISDEQVHRMRGEDDPAQAAASYRDDLIATLGAQPKLDLVMLGMGPDGHTASLFPGANPLTGEDELVRAVYAPSQSQWRITLTPRVLNAAQTVIFAAEGTSKTAALKAVREGPYDPSHFPAQIVAPLSGELIWLVDRSAAGIA
jgi:6-phosphogluconolactonase